MANNNIRDTRAEGDRYECLSDWLYACKGSDDSEVVFERLCEVIDRVINTLPPEQRRMVMAPLQSIPLKA